MCVCVCVAAQGVKGWCIVEVLCQLVFVCIVRAQGLVGGFMQLIHDKRLAYIVLSPFCMYRSRKLVRTSTTILPQASTPTAPPAPR